MSDDPKDSLLDPDFLLFMINRYGKIPLAFLLGSTVPFFFNYSLGFKTKLFLVSALNTGDGNDVTNILLNFTFQTLLQRYSSNLFGLLGLWLLLGLQYPLTYFIQGSITDSVFYKDVSRIEWQLTFYFAPYVLVTLLKVILSQLLVFTTITATIIGAWMYIPRTRYYFWLLVLKCATWFNQSEGLSIRGYAMLVWEYTGASINRWEIERTKKREHKSPSLTTRLPEYRYKPFESPRDIRLIRLHRRKFFSPPTCDIVDVELDDAPDFEAVSYTWGIGEPSIPVDVGKGYIKVTDAVHELLYYRRSIFGEKFFWIDAMAINQNNKAEKSIQIPLMSEIYGKATRVLVWLKPADITARETMILRKLLRGLGWATNVLHKLVSQSDLIFSLFNKTDQAVAFRLLAEFYQNPWFERIWVVQEVATGTTVHVMYCGICLEWDDIATGAQNIAVINELRQTIHWHTIMSRQEAIADSQNKLSSTELESRASGWIGAEHMQTIRNSLLYKKPLPLWALVIYTGQFKSKNPRDKIYALFNIASDDLDGVIIPDYNKPIDQVFIETTHYFLSQDTWFITLSLTGIGNRPIINRRDSKFVTKNLPSWVSDYANPAIAGARMPYEDPEFIAKLPKGKVTFSIENTRVIQIQIFGFDSIKVLGTVVKPTSNKDITPNNGVWDDLGDDDVKRILNNGSENMRDWYVNSKKMARENRRLHQTSSENFDNEFWQFCVRAPLVLKSGEFSSDIVLPFPAESEQARRLFEFWILQNAEEILRYSGPTVEGLAVKEAMQVQSYLIQKVIFTMGERAFCITSSGAMALVPPLSVKGDVLAYIEGGYSPGVLRLHEKSATMAQWVGTCYVDGKADYIVDANWTPCSLV